ncbi:TPA: hypothetical protein KQG29_004226 [Clostridioides difficile]|nr:hypothetical protein [Clostridioides difficile]
MKRMFLVALSLVIMVTAVGFAPSNIMKSNAQGFYGLFKGSKEVSGDCEQCKEINSKKPESTGTKQEQRKAIASIEESSAFKTTKNEILKNDGKIELLAVNVVEGTTQATVGYKVRNIDNGLSVLVYIVDFSSKEIPLEEKIYAKEVKKGEEFNLLWMMNNEEVLNVNMNKDGKVIQGNKEYTLSEFKNNNEFKERYDNITSRGSCHWVMNILCGTGGAVACYGVCGVTAIVNVLGAAGCAAACGLIGAVGCGAATAKVCGK